MPKVINLRDTRGRVPEGAVLVDRRTKWGNPFRLNSYGRSESIALYRRLALNDWHSRFDGEDALAEAWYDRLGGGITDPVALARRELRGKDLACWCAPQACHADVLLEIANDG